jgi:D-glutamate cyclase
MSIIETMRLMNDLILNQLREIIQHDIGNRGLRTDPKRNLINACPDDFASACHRLADHPSPSLAIVTGFFIPTATPPAGETDGPLGALYLARALVPLGIAVTLVTDDFCVRALTAGLAECGLSDRVPIVTLPTPARAKTMSDDEYWAETLEFRLQADAPAKVGTPTHQLAIERVGPSHADDRCHTMRGRDITDLMSPAHRLFEIAPRRGIATIGIGDGGNEIGMGKIPRAVIAANISSGDLIACRIPTDHLIVCGVSNWGAYALAAGVSYLRGQAMDPQLFDVERERHILEVMVKLGGLVDGVLGKPSATVDGLTWEQYAGVLRKISALAKQ